MTRHPVRLEQLPPDLREAAATDERGRVDHPSEELRAEVFRRFANALEPLRLRRQARRDRAPVPALHRLPPLLARLHRVGAGAARRPRAAGRVPPPELARRREPRRDALVPRAARPHLRDRRHAARRSSPPSSPSPRAPATCASTAATPTPGSSARAAPPSGSTTSTPRTSSREWVPQLRSLAERAESVYAMFNNNGRSQIPGPPGLLGEPEEETVAQAPTNARCSCRYSPRVEKRPRWKISGSPSSAAASITRPTKIVWSPPS